MTTHEPISDEEIDEIEHLLCNYSIQFIASNHDVKRLIARVRAAEREREEAIAHDRQPYPTAAAYEKVCVALQRAKDRIEDLESKLQDKYNV